MNIYGNPIASGNVSSSSLISVNNDIALYDGVGGNIIKDSGVTIGSISGGPFVALNGSTPMTGDLNLNTNDITNVTSINGTSDIYIGPGTPGTDSYVILNPSNSNGINNSIIIGDNSLTNLRNLSAVADLGTAGAPWQSIFLTGNVSGLTYSRSVDNILSLPGSQTTGNLLKSNILNKVVDDSGIVAADVVTSSSGSSTDGNIAVFDSTSGKVIKDSGLPSNIILNVAAGISSVANQTQGIAPAGQRDLWQLSSGLVANGGIMKYIESQNILYSSDWSNAVPGAHYSLDGGITWNAVVFDVVPAVAMLFSYNEAGLYVALPNYTPGDFSYTSADGINYFSTGVAPVSSDSINLVYSSVSNLFVSGQFTSVTQCISTSPDGITWTPRTTPNFHTGLVNYTILGQNNTTLVLMGDSQTQPAYSLDGGITWAFGSGSPSPKQAVAWSETKQEFIAMGVSNNVIASPDGIVWQDRGNGGFGGCVSVIWVDFPIPRYYAAYGGPGGFYAMASTVDSYLPFIQGHLDGSIVVTQAYASVVYIPQYDRFLLGVDNNLGVAYSTARPNIIKAIDSSMSVYPQYGTNVNGSVITNTVTETSLLNTGAGSLIIPANSMNLGSVTKLRFSIFLASVLALSNVTIRLRGNGNQLWQAPVLTGPITNRVLIGEIELVNVDNTNPIISSIFNQDGILPTLTSTSTVLDYTVNDTFNLTAQFSVANVGNQIQLNAMNMTLIKF